MALSIVQSKVAASSSGSSLTATFASAPTAGNLLIIAVYSLSANSVTPPAGWTAIDNAASAGLKTFYLKAPDATNSFAFTGTSITGLLQYEISGQHATTPINQHGVQVITGATGTTVSVTPSVLSTMPLALYAFNSTTATATPKSGWTEDTKDLSGPGLEEQHQTALTSDTTTAISGQVTWGESHVTATAIILVAPAAAGSPSASPSSLTFVDPASATQTSTISGGTTPYSTTVSTTNSAVATATLASTTVTVTPQGAGTCTLTVTDNASNTCTISVTVGAALSLSPTSLSFTDPASATQTSTISGGRSTFTPSTTNAGVATATVSGTTVTVTPHGAGTCTITITDADSETATISITVGAALSVSPTTLTFATPGASAQTATASGGRTTYTVGSSNTSIATASISGPTVTVTPVAVGTCIVTVTDADSETAAIFVTVNAVVTAPVGPPVRIYVFDTTGNLVDIPNPLSSTFSDVVNGGSASGQFVVPRRFVDIGTINYDYRVQVYLPDSINPWYDGYVSDFDQDQTTTGNENITVLTEGWQTYMGRGILTETLSPGVQPNGVNLGTMNADTYLTHLLALYLDAAHFGTSYVASMPITLDKLSFDGAELNKAIDDVIKQVQDATGNTFEWWVRGLAGNKPAVVIQPNQNPNKVSTAIIRQAPTAGAAIPGYLYEFKDSTIDGYKIQNSSKQLYNMIALYGGKDPQTQQTVYGAYKDSTSISLYGLRQKKVTNTNVTSTTTLSNYATVFLLLNGYPQPQGTFRALIPSDARRAGVWFQLHEPNIGALNQNIKQVRCIKVDLQTQGDIVTQTCSVTAPRPYIDNAYYAAIQQARNADSLQHVIPPQSQNSWFIAGGFNWVGSLSSPLRVVITPPVGVFNTVFPTVLGAGTDAGNWDVTLADTVTSATGDGYYEVVFTSSVLVNFGVGANAPGLVCVKTTNGLPTPYNTAVLRGWGFTVVNGVIAAARDIRIMGVLPTFLTFPGAVSNPDGSMTHLDGVYSAAYFPFSTGYSLEVTVDILKGATTSFSGIWIGDNTLTNGFRFYNYSDGTLHLDEFVGGVVTNQFLSASVGNDTLWHSFRLLVMQSDATHCTVEAGWDSYNVQPINATVALTMPSQTYVRLETAGMTGKARNYLPGASKDAFLSSAYAVTTMLTHQGGLHNTDFAGMVELPPTDANAGYWSNSKPPPLSGYHTVCYEKSGVQPSISTVPLVADFVYHASTTGLEVGFLFSCNTNSLDTDPGTGYLVQHIGTSLYIYRRNGGSYTSLVSGTVIDAGAPGDHHMRVIAFYDGAAVNIVAAIDGLQPISVRETGTAFTSGYYGMRDTTGIIFYRDISIRQSLTDATNLNPYSGLTKNLAPDSDLRMPTAFWPNNTLSGITGNNGGGGGSAFYETGTGAASGFPNAYADHMTLQGGRSYVVSGYIDATNVISGSPSWGVWGLPTVYASAYATPGKAGRWQASFTIPTTGNYQIKCDTNNCVITNGALLLFSEPQVEVGVLSTPYMSSLADNTGQFPYPSSATAIQAGIDLYGNIVGVNSTQTFNMAVPAHTTTLAVIGGNSWYDQFSIAFPASTTWLVTSVWNMIVNTNNGTNGASHLMSVGVGTGITSGTVSSLNNTGSLNAGWGSTILDDKDYPVTLTQTFNCAGGQTVVTNKNFTCVSTDTTSKTSYQRASSAFLTITRLT